MGISIIERGLAYKNLCSYEQRFLVRLYIENIKNSNISQNFFSICTYPSIIVYTIGNIGILLYFCNQAAASDGMYGAWFDAEYISFFHFYFVYYFQQSFFLNSFCEFFVGDGLFEAVVYEGTWLRIYHIPYFCFSRKLLPFLYKTNSQPMP